jgi:hypothetical protein
MRQLVQSLFNQYAYSSGKAARTARQWEQSTASADNVSLKAGFLPLFLVLQWICTFAFYTVRNHCLLTR